MFHFQFRFAYLEFDDAKKVKKYIETKQGMELEGQELFLDLANKKPDDRNQRGGRGDRGRGGGGRGGGGRGGKSGEHPGDSCFLFKRFVSSMAFLILYNHVLIFSDPTKILFVKNLSYNTTNDSLAEAFEGCSTARVAMERDNPGRSRGYVYQGTC